MDDEEFTGEFNVTITVGGAAMASPADLADALNHIGAQVKAGEIGAPVRDLNGNTVGRWNLGIVKVCPICHEPDCQY